MQEGSSIRERISNRNNELTVLKAIGILAVVSCHLGANMFTLMEVPITPSEELFPEYSYHMPLFVFISGYFYKRVYDSDVWAMVKKRFSSIRKYANCNLFYFLLCFALINLGLYDKHIVFSLKNLIVEPFLGGFQFYFNGPGWFVPFLFLVQVSYVVLRKLVNSWMAAISEKVASNDKKSRSHFGCTGDYKNKNARCQFNMTLKQELVFFAGLVVVGAVAVYVSGVNPVVNDKVKVVHSLLRVLFGLQFFELGFLYKEFIEKKIELSIKSFLIVVACKAAVYLVFGYYTFSLRIVDFNGHVILPFVVSVLGIMYCMHLARFIMFLTKQPTSRIGLLICMIGDNTWSIMMHHLLVKWVLDKVYNMSFMPDGLASVGDYLISPVLCVLVPLVFARLYDWFMNRFRDSGFAFKKVIFAKRI